MKRQTTTTTPDKMPKPMDEAMPNPSRENNGIASPQIKAMIATAIDFSGMYASNTSVSSCQ
jgi:hypothetical protein